jgi:serine/threonine-protein kinase PpkA
MHKDFSPVGYEIVREISHGGMATVYLARQRSLNRMVALKLMSQKLQQKAGFRELFIREARLVAQLDHPNIIRIHDIVEDGVYLYIVMEYADGGNLKRRIRDGMTERQALHVARAIASALHFVHAENILHYDIKPENILFRSEERVILADFGIARSLADKNPAASLLDTSTGTPAYMAPEQFTSGSMGVAGEVDRRTDMYALGVVLYEMLTGEQPYKAASWSELQLLHIRNEIPRLPSRLERYQELVDTLMAGDPMERPANGRKVVALIDELLGGR